MPEFTTIGPECFIDGEVICYKGVNYYRRCDIWVYDSAEGTSFSCFKRLGHVSPVHEAHDGTKRDVYEPFKYPEQSAIRTSYPRLTEIVKEISEAFKDLPRIEVEKEPENSVSVMDPVEKAKFLVAQHYNRNHTSKGPYRALTTQEVFVVWFQHTGKDWFAALEVFYPLGPRYELRYSEEDQQTFIGVYDLRSHMTITDEDLETSLHEFP